MIPEPLHPAVVHFPIVLAVLLPIFALGTLWAIRRGASPLRAWSLPVALAGALALSAWVAVETGEAQEERVEAVLAEGVLEEHEEAGERFLLLAAVLFLVTGVGLVPGTLGAAGRFVGTAGAALLVVAAVQVGAAGGELVYEHGAASVYVGAAGTASPDPLPDGSGQRDDDDHDADRTDPGRRR